MIRLVSLSAFILSGFVADVRANDEIEYAAGDVFRDCDDCPEMVVVPAGEFMMGARPYDKLVKLPYHKREIEVSFAIGKFEVTYSQYLECYESKGCSKKPYPFGWGGKTHPVSALTWVEAIEYTQWPR